MAKLFSKQRRQSLQNTKYGKYLSYAFGEVLLIVLGVNIALWYQSSVDFKKERKTEVKILREISSNLPSDLKEIQSDIKELKLIITATETLDSSSSKLAYLVKNPHFNPNKSGYTLLQSKGVELLTNDAIRVAITDLYEREYAYYSKYESERIEFINANIKPALLDSYRWNKTADFPGYEVTPTLSNEPRSHLAGYNSYAQMSAEELVGKAQVVENKIKSLQKLLNMLLEN